MVEYVPKAFMGYIDLMVDDNMAMAHRLCAVCRIELKEIANDVSAHELELSDAVHFIRCCHPQVFEGIPKVAGRNRPFVRSASGARFIELCEARREALISFIMAHAGTCNCNEL